MKDGIYFVKFRSGSPHNDWGDGTVIIQNNIINGGDFAYVYRGTINEREATLTIEKHSESGKSIFGNLDRFELNLNIVEQGEYYNLSGAFEGSQITITAKYIGELLN